MTIPTCCSVIGDNRQLRGIASREFTPDDEAAYRASLADAYRQQIEGSTITAPALAEILTQELNALLTLDAAALAAYPAREPNRSQVL